MITILHDQFRTQDSFLGSKFVYSVVRSLHSFFDQVTECEDLATEGNPSYLTRKAVELIAMEKVADGVTLAIDLPAVLTTNTLDVTPELNDHLASCFLQLMGI
jgi:hypothetical protein